ncbi:MAG: hypothetical protein RLZZ490_2513 [Cyanobacteriota bacterium]|jgi:hypothetical protein
MAGTLADTMDFVEWSAFYETWESVQARIKVLGRSH